MHARRFTTAVFIALCVASVGTAVWAQGESRRPEITREQVLLDAKQSAEKVFAHLEKSETEVVARWIVTEVGSGWGEVEQEARAGEFKAKLDAVLMGAPNGVYGALDGYDLIDATFLPGSDRYLRLTYLTYHEGSLLTWEFRFYVKPNTELTLNFITWSENNPFEYLTTPDMLLGVDRPCPNPPEMPLSADSVARRR